MEKIKTTKNYLIENEIIKKDTNVHIYEKISEKNHKENIDLISRYSNLVKYLKDK